MTKRKVRVSGYGRKGKHIHAHSRKGTRVKSYTQMRQSSKKSKD